MYKFILILISTICTGCTVNYVKTPKDITIKYDKGDPIDEYIRDLTAIKVK